MHTCRFPGVHHADMGAQGICWHMLTVGWVPAFLGLPPLAGLGFRHRKQGPYIHQCTGHHVAHGHSLTLTLSQLQEQQKEPEGIYLATLCFSKGAVLQWSWLVCLWAEDPEFASSSCLPRMPIRSITWGILQKRRMLFGFLHFQGGHTNVLSFPKAFQMSMKEWMGKRSRKIQDFHESLSKTHLGKSFIPSTEFSLKHIRLWFPLSQSPSK